MSVSSSASQPVSRRRAIQIIALGGLALGVGLEELRHLSTQPRLSRVHETRLLMGTLATLTVVTDQPTLARVAIEAAFSRMNRLEQIFSRFIPGSQVSILNRTGSLTGAAPDLCRVIERAVECSESTRGAFDITIEPVLAVYREAAQQGRLPEQSVVRERQTLVNYRYLQQQGDTINLRRQGMAVTLDGLAKGYVLDAGADELLRHGLADVLVEAGGDLMARGMTANGGWRIGIQAPRKAVGELLGMVQVENAALATSGDYLDHFGGDYTQHHILDPMTGVSPAELSSVSVLAPTACEADALSTSFMVLGADDSFAVIQQRSRVAAFVVSKHGAQYRSNNFSLYNGSVNPILRQ